MSKKLLEESTIRQFMKLAQLEPLASDFLEEKKHRPKKRPMREEEMEEGITDPPKKVKVAPPELDKGATMRATEKADAEARAEIEKKPGDVEATNEAMTDTMEEELMDEMGGDYPMEEMMDGLYEEEDDVEMEAEEGDMEAEINITPDQARAIIAVADMLKDIMPDLEAPEAEEEEEEVEMPEMEPEEEEAEEEEKVETPEGEGEEEAEEEVELQEEVVEESLEEQIMNRVKARLKELSNK